MQFAPLAFAAPCSSPDPGRSGLPAEPLLRLRRHRAPGAARRRDRARAHRGRADDTTGIERAVTPRRSRAQMKLAFIVDPLDEFKIYKDTTFAMMREAAARGHELYAMHQGDLAWTKGGVTGNAARLHLTGEKTGAWYLLEPPAERAAHGLRRRAHAQGPAVRHGVRLQHVPARARREARARASSTARARSATTTRRWRSRSSRSSPRRRSSRAASTLIRAFLAEHRDIILKPLDGMGGASIFRVQRERSQPQRHRRDADRATARRRSWRSATSPRSATATSACC